MMNSVACRDCCLEPPQGWGLSSAEERTRYQVPLLAQQKYTLIEWTRCQTLENSVSQQFLQSHKKPRDWWSGAWRVSMSPESRGKWRSLGRDPPRQDVKDLHQFSETAWLGSLPCLHVIGRQDRMFVLALICFGHCAQSTCGHVAAQDGPALTLGLHLHPCCPHLGRFSVLHSLHFGYFGVFSLWQAHSSPLAPLSSFTCLLNSSLICWLRYRVQAHTTHCTTGP